jgi:glycosyltransferase involved in cell wall biosynthesis
VVFEALAFGKPVIGARRGGIPEMIHAGENGLLFEPEHPEELVAALRQLAGDAALRTRMGQAARASAAPFLDRDGWIDCYATLYADLARRPAPAGRTAASLPPRKDTP